MDSSADITETLPSTLEFKSSFIRTILSYMVYLPFYNQTTWTLFGEKGNVELIPFKNLLNLQNACTLEGE